MSVSGNIGSATDTGVKLIIDVGYDDSKIKQLIAAEVAKQLAAAAPQGAATPTGAPPRKGGQAGKPPAGGPYTPGLPVPEPDDEGYTVRGGKGYGRGIGQYGYGHEPRVPFKEQPEPFRTLPKSAGEQPLRDDQLQERDYSPISSAPDTYQQLRGFQQSKVSRRGDVRRSHTISPAFEPEQAPALATFAQQREMEKRQREAERALAIIERGNARMSAAQRHLWSQITGIGGSLARSSSATVAASGQNMIPQFLSMLSASSPHFAAFLAAVTAAPVAAKMAEQLIKFLSQKGHPLNRDWTRAIHMEVMDIFSLKDEYRRILGIDRFLVTQEDTYNPLTGETVYNSGAARDEVILGRVTGAKEIAIGVENP